MEVLFGAADSCSSGNSLTEENTNELISDASNVTATRDHHNLSIESS